jgi:uncharacterized membrane protein
MATTIMASLNGGPQKHSQISEPLARNIDELMQRRRRDLANEGLADKVAAHMAAFTGSTWSLLVHAVVFGAWILVNTAVLPLLEPWDPTLVVLAMIASVEAIFLTSFVLMNQRRQSRLEDNRAELTLQMSLLAEHEMTKIAEVTLAIARQLGVPEPHGMDADALTSAVAPEAILDEIDRKRPD